MILYTQLHRSCVCKRGKLSTVLTSQGCAQSTRTCRMLRAPHSPEQESALHAIHWEKWCEVVCAMMAASPILHRTSNRLERKAINTTCWAMPRPMKLMNPTDHDQLCLISVTHCVELCSGQAPQSGAANHGLEQG